MSDFIYAKKLILPSTAANVLQSLCMADAFARLASGSGASFHFSFFPGVRTERGKTRQSVVNEVCRDLGHASFAAGAWRVLPGKNKGLYGLLFHFSLLHALVTRPGGIFYSRDISEALFLARAAELLRLSRCLVFEMHETLHRQAHNAVNPAVAATLKAREQRVMDSLRGLVVIHPDLAAQARELFGYGGPALVEPSGYNPALFHPLPLFTQDSPWPGEADPVYLVYVGRFHQGKGVENLIAAMDYLPERFHLRIIGGAPQSRFAALQEMAIAVPRRTPRIAFHGALPQTAIRAACAGTHIFVIPQEDATVYFSPLKLTEALALGLPVLASPLTTFNADAEQGRLALAPDSSPQGLAAGVLALAASPHQAASLRERGLAAAAPLSWTARAKRIADFCAKI